MLDKIFDIDKRLAKMNTHIVICYKNKDKYQEDDKNYLEMSKYTKLKKEYRAFSKKSKCKILFLNTSDEKLEKQIKKILKFIDK